MTTVQAIALLLKPLTNLTDEEFDCFTANRDLLRAVSKTPEYNRALLEQIRSEKVVPGASHTSHLHDHVTHASGGRKTVCTSAALAYFNIAPARYHYSGHTDQDNAILRRHGWSVRSRKSKYGIKQGCASGITLGNIRSKLATEKASEEVHYKVSIKTREGYHCIVIGRDGSVVVDTADSLTNNHCKVRDIYSVTRKG
tara:strand:- start:314 stop:907 length:594 start_codon:yes stop_codon:yes gene_type:complete